MGILPALRALTRARGAHDSGVSRAAWDTILVMIAL